MHKSILFTDALIVDGTGAKARRGDVLVENGRIAGIGRGLGAAERTVPAGGRILCPGFIDMHSHADFTLTQSPRAINLLAQGITLVLGGNCGSSAAPAHGDMAGTAPHPGIHPWDGPLQDWFDHLEGVGLGINVAMLAGHGTLRGGVMGIDATGPATDSEIDAMRQLLADCLQAGAFGMSTGRDYVPGCYAAPEEIVAVGREMSGRSSCMYASHLLDEAWDLLPSVQEAADIAAQIGVAVQLSHHKAMIPGNWGAVRDSLALVDELVSRGSDVRLDVYPYTFAAARDLSSLLPPWFTADGTDETLRRMRKREDFSRLHSDLQSGYPGWHSEIAAFRWGYTVLHSPGHPDWEGRTLADLASDAGVDPLEIIRSLILRDGGETVCAFTMSEDDVRTIIRHPRAAICTDAAAIDDPASASRPIHPRAYGTYPRLLGRYVREEEILALEEAVHKCTGLPARWLNLPDRGVLREGAAADMVLFDKQLVGDCATLHEPTAPPDGVDWVLVNGVPAVEDGELTDKTSGVTVRRGEEGAA